MKKKYYIRISADSVKEFETYLYDNKFEHECLTFSGSLTTSTSLFAAMLDNEEALLLKLKFPCVGFLDFAKTLGRQIKQV